MYERLYKLSSIFYKLAKEAPQSAPFGEYAWAPHREDVKGKEPDNELEKTIYKQLQKHFGDYNNKRTGLPKITTEFLYLLMEKGWYKEILHSPPYKTLYRGLHFKTEEELAEFLGKPFDDVKDSGSINLKPPQSFPVQNGWTTSWSFKKKITKDFSEAKKKGFAVTLIADAKDNPNRFIAGPGGLYDVYGLSMYHLEKETVGLEPILVRKIEWTKL